MQADEKGRFTEQALFYKPSIREALLDIQRLGFIVFISYSHIFSFQKPYKVIESQLYHAVNLIINLNLMSCVKRILKLTSVLWQNYAAGMEILVRAPLTRPVILERR